MFLRNARLNAFQKLISVAGTTITLSSAVDEKACYSLFQSFQANLFRSTNWFTAGAGNYANSHGPLSWSSATLHGEPNFVADNY